jgi:hypothetical protein
MNTELPDDVFLAGGEVVPVPQVPLNPFDFLGFALQMQIRVCEAMIMPHDYIQAWRKLWKPLLPTEPDAE